ncbi:MAG: SPOR domain-containing protein [Bacteroidales bacterium]|jgi:hypothetical protein|nr:SPOR domain-containing protein [Bacteroidales bacterium]MDD4604509.1 SPOR domain-containing protein [Bacteroidales bacterium]
MKRKFKCGFFLFFFLLLCCYGKGQGTGSMEQKIEINQDSRIDQLVAKHVLINQQIKGTDGYRIQIYSDSGNNSKARAQAVLDEFIAKYPTVGAYLTFKSPNYKVRVGDFRTWLDAQRILIEITSDYQNAFIIADIINLPSTN